MWGVVLAPGSAFADGWSNVSTGARTTAMGGTGIAGGGDSAMATLNPAGITRVGGTLLSLSASVYNVDGVTVPDYVADQDTLMSANGPLMVSQRGIASREFGAFPSGAAYFLHLGTAEAPMVLAASLSIPRQINRRVVQNLEFVGDNVAIQSNLTTVIQETAYRAALSWGMGFGRLRLGASVIGAYTQRLQTQEQSDLTVLGTSTFVREQSKSTRDLSSFDLGATLGAQWDVLDGLRLGLSVRSPSVHLTGTLEGSVDTTFLDEGQSSVTAIQFRGDATRGFPLRVGLGAEVYGDRWTLALDGRLHVPRTAEFEVSGEALTSSLGGDGGAAPDQMRDLLQIEETRVTVDVSLGFELWLGDEDALRFGAFTQMSAQPSAADQLAARATPRSRPDDVFRVPIDRFGATAGWGTRVGPADTTTGLRAAFGSGDTLRRAPDRRFDPTAPAETTGAFVYDIQVFLSAAVDLGEAAAALTGGDS